MTITADELKRFALDSGADLVGVAPCERFDEAPEGHRPEDILPGARAVVACARRIPVGTLDGPGTDLCDREQDSQSRDLDPSGNHL